jgi:hypothetical protein
MPATAAVPMAALYNPLIMGMFNQTRNSDRASTT